MTAGTGQSPATPIEEAVWRTLERIYHESPIHQVLGLTMAVKGPGSVEIYYDGRRAAANRHEIVAGGVLATMVDSAVMQACRTQLSEQDAVTTIELKTNYLGAAAAGVPLRALGTLEHLGKTTCVGIARVFDPNGRALVFGSSTIAIRRSS